MTSRAAPALLLLAALLGAGCDNGGSAPSGGETPAPLPAVGGDRAVEEGDIVRVVGSDVFVLNAWKGLLVVSLADPAQPRITARVPLGGLARPVEMFIRNGQVLALVDNTLDYLPCASCALGVSPVRNSELIVVDASTPAAAHVTARVGIPGHAQEARLAGDVMYAVALDGNVVVTSIDVSDPPRARPVDRVDIPVRSAAVHLHMPGGVLYVVASDPQSPLGECGDYRQLDGCTFLSAVDVGAPDGRLRLGATYAMAGHMLDRDSIDLSGGVLRVLVREGSLVATHPAKLRTFQARTAGELEPLASLLLGDEVSAQLTAVRFDGPRAFAVTARHDDPLYTIDIADPAHPRVAGHLATPAALDHIEVRGGRLIALGGPLDAPSPTSSATEPVNRQLQVSLYDVSDLAAPHLLDQVLFDGGSFPAVSDDDDGLGRSFRIVDDRSLIVVPYANLFHDDSWNYMRKEPHVALVSFTADNLTLLGQIPHPGILRRAVSYGTASLITLSDAALQVVDVPADAPTVTGRLELSRNVLDAAFSNGKAVALSVDPGSGAATLSAGAADGFDVSAAGLPSTSLATTSARVFLNGDVATLVSFRITSPNTAVELFDVTDPARIRHRGSLAFDLKGSSLYGPVPTTIVHLGVGAMVDMAGPSVAALVEMGDTGGGLVGPGGLILVDVTDPDHPGMAGRLDLGGVRNLGILHADAGRLTVATEEWAPGADRHGSSFDGAFFLSTVDITNPSAPVLIRKSLLFGSPLAGSDRFVISDGGRGMASIERLSPTGELTSIAALNTLGGLQATAAIEGTRAVFTLGNQLDVVDLDPVAAGKATVLANVYTPLVEALVGGRVCLASGEVIDLRGSDPQQIAFLPPDSDGVLRAVRAEITTATGHPVRAYYVGGFRGIQAVPLE